MKYLAVLDYSNMSGKITHQLFENASKDDLHIFDDIEDIDEAVHCISNYFLNKDYLDIDEDDIHCYIKCVDTGILNIIKICKNDEYDYDGEVCSDYLTRIAFEDGNETITKNSFIDGNINYTKFEDVEDIDDLMQRASYHYLNQCSPELNELYIFAKNVEMEHVFKIKLIKKTVYTGNIDQVIHLKD
jgi:hypothetical protein